MLNLQSNYFYYSAASIIFNPTFWNIAARSEYRYKIFSRTFGGPKNGCYVLGATIFLLGLLLLFESVPDLVKLIAALIFLTGNILVLSSMYKLGFVGTYLGDYFGFLMDEMIVSFPFNYMLAIKLLRNLNMNLRTSYTAKRMPKIM
ncbi:hypothetical protein BB560_004072 [Smittium megazygosporum]|uniref:phosphatidyl-N-methylethanolamine N-methyltransferase n=1 Tax=Smittium megazygosporum TaxID=133381 RepID=A0A2T9ZA90_9FUNG|nr:hypothetical protein BB560_004072 [Smittium megazygosporum]